MVPLTTQYASTKLKIHVFHFAKEDRRMKSLLHIVKRFTSAILNRQWDYGGSSSCCSKLIIKRPGLAALNIWMDLFSHNLLTVLKLYFSHSRKKRKKQPDNSCRLLKQKMLLINVKGWHYGATQMKTEERPFATWASHALLLQRHSGRSGNSLQIVTYNETRSQMTAVTTRQSAFITIIRFQVTATFQQSDSKLQQHSRSETDMLGKRLWIDTLYRHSFLFF